MRNRAMSASMNRIAHRRRSTRAAGPAARTRMSGSYAGVKYGW